MTGSLQIKNNKYYAVLNFTGEDGKRRQKWIPTNLEVRGNKRKATEILHQLEETYDDKSLQAENLLLADYFAAWLERIKPTIEPCTYRSYSGNMKNHIIPYFRQKRLKLHELKPYHLEDYYAAKLSSIRPLSTQTVRHHHQNISKALNDAARHELIPGNPAQKAKLPKAKKYIGAFLNPNQLQQLLALFRGMEIEFAVMFIATYGMRRSEALGLCWQNVDFENDQFTISRVLIQHTGESYYVKDCTKNESSYRTLPLTKDVRLMLEQIRQRQSLNREQFGNAYHESDSVFTWPDGTLISPNYLTRMFHKTIAASDLPPIRLHDLRHSTASNLLANNFSVVEVQHWLGHSQASTTLNFYSHIDATSKRNITAALENLLPLEIR